MYYGLWLSLFMFECVCVRVFVNVYVCMLGGGEGVGWERERVYECEKENSKWCVCVWMCKRVCERSECVQVYMNASLLLIVMVKSGWKSGCFWSLWAVFSFWACIRCSFSWSGCKNICHLEQFVVYSCMPKFLTTMAFWKPSQFLS